MFCVVGAQLISIDEAPNDISWSLSCTSYGFHLKFGIPANPVPTTTPHRRRDRVMAKSENEFSTISDASKALRQLIDEGFGDLPMQLIVAPDSTMQAIGRHADGSVGKNPVLMLQFDGINGRVSVTIMSTERLSSSGGMETLKSQ